MNKFEQTSVLDYFMSRMRETLLNKGDDYANKDRLSNFKLAGTIAGGSAELNCLNMISTKVARLGVLLNSTTQPKNESIQDSILDLANYAALLYMITNEKNATTGLPTNNS